MGQMVRLRTRLSNFIEQRADRLQQRPRIGRFAEVGGAAENRVPEHVRVVQAVVSTNGIPTDVNIDATGVTFHCRD